MKILGLLIKFCLLGVIVVRIMCVCIFCVCRVFRLCCLSQVCVMCSLCALNVCVDFMFIVYVREYGVYVELGCVYCV